MFVGVWWACLLGWHCVQWNDSSVQCAVPEGYGRDLPVKLHMASLIPSDARAGAERDAECPLVLEVTTTATFSYSDPVVTSMSIGHGPPVGGTVVTLVGSGFGSGTMGGVPSVFLLTQVSASEDREVEVPQVVLSFNHDRLVIQVGPGMGANLTLVVAHGSTGARATVARAWSYDAPVVVDVAPVVADSGSSRRVLGSASGSNSSFDLPCNSSSGVDSTGCVRRWFPATSTVLEISGQNFGSDAASACAGGGIVVMVGGVRCEPMNASSVYVSNTLLRCRVSALPVGSSGISVAFAGQAVSVPPTLELVALCGPGFYGKPGVCGLWAVGCGLWAVGCGLWAVGCGLWAVGCGLCTLGCRL
jgi:hypothetical protein